MKDQHKKITGYRDLSEYEIQIMNEAKKTAELVGNLVSEFANVEEIDKRCLALAKTNLQQGFMWLIRSVAKPTTFG